MPSPNLDGAGVVGVLDADGWRAAAFDTAPAYPFVNFAAGTCDGSGLAVGGDFAMVGHVTADGDFTHLGGGTLATDLLISNVVLTCGGVTRVGVGVPGGPSLFAEIGGDPPVVVERDEEVPGHLIDAACHDGVVYITDGAAVRRYR